MRLLPSSYEGVLILQWLSILLGKILFFFIYSFEFSEDLFWLVYLYGYFN